MEVSLLEGPVCDWCSAKGGMNDAQEGKNGAEAGEQVTDPEARYCSHV